MFLRPGLFWLDSRCLVKYWSGLVVRREDRALPTGRDSGGTEAGFKKTRGLTNQRFSCVLPLLAQVSEQVRKRISERREEARGCFLEGLKGRGAPP